MLYDQALSVLHEVSQGFLFPTIIILLLLVIVSIMAIGSLLIEYIMEKRKNTTDIPVMAEAIKGQGAKEIRLIINDSSLSKYQKKALTELSHHLKLSKNALIGVAEGLVADAEGHYSRIVRFTDTIIKLGPMLGLMGTLIPLGPGIVALGNGDIQTLSKAMLTAFDTTVVGLISGGICLVISVIRKSWYSKYMSQLETLTECILAEAEHGTIA